MYGAYHEETGRVTYFRLGPLAIGWSRRWPTARLRSRSTGTGGWSMVHGPRDAVRVDTVADLRALLRHTFGRDCALELANYLVNTLLRDTDCMSMAHSLEVLVPFVDGEVVDFVTSLPDAWRAGRRPKALLPEAMGQPDVVRVTSTTSRSRCGGSSIRWRCAPGGRSSRRATRAGPGPGRCTCWTSGCAGTWRDQGTAVPSLLPESQQSQGIGEGEDLDSAPAAAEQRAEVGAISGHQRIRPRLGGGRDGASWSGNPRSRAQRTRLVGASGARTRVQSTASRRGT